VRSSRQYEDMGQMMAHDPKQLSDVRRVWLDRNGQVIDVVGALAAAGGADALSRRSQALLALAGQSAPEGAWYVLMVHRNADIAVDNCLGVAGIERWMAAQTVMPKRRGGRPH